MPDRCKRPLPEEDAFIEAIYAAPDADAPRLIYADWLEEKGDRRCAYLRAEVGAFRNGGRGQQAVWDLLEGVDQVWAARVSRPPFGIMVPGLTFFDTGPRIGPADLRVVEEAWGVPLPPDYAAFLLQHNGGRPNKPYLYSYSRQDGEKVEYYDAVWFYSVLDRSPEGRPFLLMNVIEMFDGHVADDEDEERLARMMPIGTLTTEDECGQNVLALLMDPDEEYERIIHVEYWDHAGLGLADDVHWKCAFSELLDELCYRLE